MRLQPPPDARIELLNAVQPDRPWHSCAEQRRCAACEHIFCGEEVIVRSTRRHSIELACPKCGGGPALWVRLGNPLLDDEAWRDWQSAMEFAEAESAAALETVG